MDGLVAQVAREAPLGAWAAFSSVGTGDGASPLASHADTVLHRILVQVQEAWNHTPYAVLKLGPSAAAPGPTAPAHRGAMHSPAHWAALAPLIRSTVGLGACASPFASAPGAAPGAMDCGDEETLAGGGSAAMADALCPASPHGNAALSSPPPVPPSMLDCGPLRRGGGVGENGAALTGHVPSSHGLRGSPFGATDATVAFPPTPFGTTSMHPAAVSPSCDMTPLSVLSTRLRAGQAGGCAAATEVTVQLWPQGESKLKFSHHSFFCTT